MAYVFTFTSNPGNLFKISGNQILVNSSTIAAGDYPVTVRADDGQGSVVITNYLLTATAAAAPPPAALKFNVSSNSQYIGTAM